MRRRNKINILKTRARLNTRVRIRLLRDLTMRRDGKLFYVPVPGFEHEDVPPAPGPLPALPIDPAAAVAGAPLHGEPEQQMDRSHRQAAAMGPVVIDIDQPPVNKDDDDPQMDDAGADKK
jgi:hypothetical protein